MYTGVQHTFNIKWCSCCLAVTCRVSLVVQELLTLPDHLSSPPLFGGICAVQSFCVVFVDHCLSFFSWPLYCHCIAFHFVIYGFWLPLVYHQTFSLGHCFAIVLPFILLFMVSDYHLYIIKLFLLAIVLPFILLFMVSDYHLYIIKLLLTCAELNLF